MDRITPMKWKEFILQTSVSAIIFVIINGIFNRLFAFKLWINIMWSLLVVLTLFFVFLFIKEKRKKKNAIKKLKGLIERTKELKYKDNNELDKIKKTMEMLIRKAPNNISHYLEDLKNISFFPQVAAVINEEFARDMEFAFGSGNYQRAPEPNEREYWENGKSKLINLIETIIEDLES